MDLITFVLDVVGMVAFGVCAILTYRAFRK
jgi:hypothetical protein